MTDNFENILKEVNPHILNKVVEWIAMAHGSFRLSDMCRELHYDSRVEKEQARVVIGKLCYAGHLKPHKSQNGVFIKTSVNLEKMTKVKDRKGKVDIKLPLDLHEKVVLIPGSVIIIAGVSNAGKSAWMLNTCELNMDKHKIRYVSSEWSNEERDVHLEDFGADIDEWDSKIDFYAKDCVSTSFDNYIDPDCINIIDYFENYDDYSKIGGEIRDISDKLKSGIAIIAMQKKSNTQHAYGGESTVNRSQLYINIDFNETDFKRRIATIRKLKKAVHRKYNIERLSCEFEYDEVGRIVKKTGWGKVVEIKRKGVVEEKYIQAESWANTKQEEVIKWGA